MSSPATALSPAAPSAPAPLTKKILTADHPTWCPGCGDFAVLAAYYRVLERLQYPHQNIVTLAGIGCSSRFPYFVNTHGVHYIHGRSLPFAAAVSLGRDDLHVFVFGGDGDGFSIGGNHLVHTGRKNVRLTYVIMDNFVYGLTKKQTSPTSPIGFKSKTDPTGSLDQPHQPDAHARQQRSHLRRPQPRDPGEPHDRDDGARRAPRRLLRGRDPLRVRRVLRGRLRRRGPPQGRPVQGHRGEEERRNARGRPAPRPLRRGRGLPAGVAGRGPASSASSTSRTGRRRTASRPT